MSKTKKLKRIPKFKNEKEEAEFWDTHDSTRYIDWDKAITLKRDALIKSSRNLSPRCPHHKDQVLYTRWRTVVVADGFASLNNLRELYCPRGDYTQLARESKTLMKKAESALRRVKPKSEKMSAQSKVV